MTVMDDKIKILIDGVAINNEISGSSFFYMDFPLQLIDNIEVLLGPQGTLFGRNVTGGAVLLNTRKPGDEL